MRPQGVAKRRPKQTQKLQFGFSGEAVCAADYRRAPVASPPSTIAPHTTRGDQLDIPTTQIERTSGEGVQVDDGHLRSALPPSPMLENTPHLQTLQALALLGSDGGLSGATLNSALTAVFAAAEGAIATADTLGQFGAVHAPETIPMSHALLQQVTPAPRASRSASGVGKHSLDGGLAGDNENTEGNIQGQTSVVEDPSGGAVGLVGQSSPVGAVLQGDDGEATCSVDGGEATCSVDEGDVIAADSP